MVCCSFYSCFFRVGCLILRLVIFYCISLLIFLLKLLQDAQRQLTAKNNGVQEVAQDQERMLQCLRETLHNKDQEVSELDFKKMCLVFCCLQVIVANVLPLYIVM